MTHLALPWWPRTTSATTSGGNAHGRGRGGPATTTTSASGSSSSSNCCGLSRLMRRLKKRSKMLQPGSGRHSSSSLQCRYDPLSYSLNFDSSGSGDFVDDDYYKFYAFSSRFVATPRTDCQRLVVAASH